MDEQRIWLLSGTGEGPPLAAELLRLQRPMLTSHGATVLAGIEELATLPLEQDSLLLALGARELAAALRHSRAREHAVRLLPSATALGQALQLGLPAERIACLRPQTRSSIEGSVEAGLCRRWGITAVLARQSGGPPEQQWHQICQSMDLKLLLLARPENHDLHGLELEALLARLGWPS